MNMHASQDSWTIITPFEISQDSRAERLSMELRRRGYSVNLIGTSGDGRNATRTLRRARKYLRAFRSIRSCTSRVLVCVNSEATLIAAVMKAMGIAKYKVLVADIYDHHGFIFRRLTGLAFHVVEDAAVLTADQVILPIEERLSQYGFLARKRLMRKAVYISNLGFPNADAAVKQPVRNPHVQDGGHERITAIYAGTIDHGRGILSIAQAAKISPAIKAVIYGVGPLLKTYQRDPNFCEIYAGTFNAKQISEIYEGADIIFAFYELSVLNNQYCDPNKLREALEFQKPIITNSGTPLSHVVQRLGIGVVLESVDARTIVAALTHVRDNYEEFMGRVIRSGGYVSAKMGENGLALDNLLKYVEANCLN